MAIQKFNAPKIDHNQPPCKFAIKFNYQCTFMNKIFFIQDTNNAQKKSII